MCICRFVRMILLKLLGFILAVFLVIPISKWFVQIHVTMLTQKICSTLKRKDRRKIEYNTTDISIELKIQKENRMINDIDTKN